MVTTKTMITDLVNNIGGDQINLKGLMGSGVDPHLYKASEGDVSSPALAHDVVDGDVEFIGNLSDDDRVSFSGSHRASSHCLSSCSGFQSAM